MKSLIAQTWFPQLSIVWSPELKLFYIQNLQTEEQTSIHQLQYLSKKMKYVLMTERILTEQ